MDGPRHTRDTTALFDRRAPEIHQPVKRVRIVIFADAACSELASVGTTI
jgi:hypothetical protein